MKIFAQRIKALRRENGYTQTQLAQMLGTSRTAISNWENGTRVPDSGTVAKIAAIFRVNADSLLGTTVNYKSIASAGIDISDLNELGINELRKYFRYLSLDERYTVK